MRTKILGVIAVCAGLVLGSGAAWAEPVVVLTSHNGATMLEGELMGFDGATYILRTGVGTINVDASQVTCVGEGCPEPAAIDTGTATNTGNGDAATEGAATEGAATEGAATEGAATEGAATEGAATEGAATEGAATEGAATEGAATKNTATKNTGGQIDDAGQTTDSGPFSIAGSNVIGDALTPALIEGYADALGVELVREIGAGENERVFRLIDKNENEVVAIRVSAHGTATGFPALAEDAVRIALASRRIDGPEAGLPDLRDTPNEHILALDGLIVIVHQDNPVRSLTLDQIASVFNGRIANWAELGGPDLPVNIYAPDDRSGTMAVFDAMVMQPRDYGIADKAERLEDHADLSDLVSIDPAGIGLTGFAYARASRMLAIRQECGLVSAPTAFAMKTEEYPLGRRLYAYSSNKDPRSAYASGLLDFALSDAAQAMIAEAGFADRGIEGQGIEVQGGRLAHSLTSPEEFSLPVFQEMLTEIKDAERLSITFRFFLGSSNLEVRSQSEAERFARLLADGAYPGKDILLIGFTDSVGDFNVNRGLAVRRAQSVLDTLKASVRPGALDTVPILVQSYGELTPVGCNETNEGRELNRRVEVWVRDKRG